MTQDEYEDEVHRLAQLTLMSLIQAQTRENDPGMALDTRLSIDALIYVTAALVEADSGAVTRSGMRQMSEQIGKHIASTTRRMRTQFEASGVRGIEELGTVPVSPDEIPSKVAH